MPRVGSTRRPHTLVPEVFEEARRDRNRLLVEETLRAPDKADDERRTRGLFTIIDEARDDVVPPGGLAAAEDDTDRAA